MTAFAEPEDVREVMQETNANFGSNELDTAFVEDAIDGISRWLKRNSGHFWYDSSAGSGDLIDSSAAQATNLVLSVPESPHRQGHQLFRESRGQLAYPNTHTGQYVRVKLPRYGVDSIDTLEVRDFGGGVTDWVADSGFTEGRGEDYYLQIDESGGFQTSYLYLHSGSLGVHQSYEDVLTVDVTYGVDYQSDPWDSVRRGVAALAAAQLVVDDDVVAQITDDGQLIGVDMKADELRQVAVGDTGLLTPYIGLQDV